jgi:hypothetical protein
MTPCGAEPSPTAMCLVSPVFGSSQPSSPDPCAVYQTPPSRAGATSWGQLPTGTGYARSSSPSRPQRFSPRTVRSGGRASIDRLHRLGSRRSRRPTDAFACPWRSLPTSWQQRSAPRATAFRSSARSCPLHLQAPHSCAFSLVQNNEVSAPPGLGQAARRGIPSPRSICPSCLPRALQQRRPRPEADAIRPHRQRPR